MRLKIRHETIYTYSQPVRAAVQSLRLTPRNHDGQFVKRWRIELDADYRLYRDEDPFGNITHFFSIVGPIESINVAVEGEVDTRDMAGLVQGAAERFPLAFWKRETRASAADPAIRAFAADVAAPHGTDRLSTAHALNSAVHGALAYLPDATDTTTTAAEAFAARAGAAQDFAQVLIACARSVGLPARYAGGYLCKESSVEQTAGHAWAEIHVEGYGWIAFDAVNDLCATDRYVRVAIGPDSLDAAPLRGAQRGGEDETLQVRISVAQGRALVEG